MTNSPGPTTSAPLHCPHCQAHILAQQIDRQLQATCAQCEQVFSVAGQLEGRLAYYHPKEMKIASPPSLWLERLPDGSLQVKLPQPRPLKLSWPLAFVASLSDAFNKVVITINQAYLSVHDMPLPGLELNKKQFARAEIDQLYLKRSSSPGSLRPQYELWTLLQGGQTVLLLAGLEDWLAALYLEQQLEAGLGLADRLVGEEVSYLSPEERRHLLEWAALVEDPNLAFVSRPGGGYYEGHYPKLDLSFVPRPGGSGYYEVHYLRGDLFQLDAFSQPYGDRFITYTRLRLIKARLVPPDLPPEEEPEIKMKLTTEALTHLLLPLDRPDELKGTLEIRPEADMIYYEQVGIETDLAYLRKLFDLLSQVAQAYPRILAWGGVAVPHLKALSPLKPGYLKAIAAQLIEGIQSETAQRLSQQSSRWWCPNCLVRRVGQIEIQDLSPAYYYYGCRLCGQSQTFFRGRVIAVLDQQMKLNQVRDKHVRRVNWLHYRTMFDFEQVEIVQATDEDVERLAMQLGNDTDSRRELARKNMVCRVMAECQLSENTWKILQRTFRRVEGGKQGKTT